jgi:hypothetical protein
MKSRKRRINEEEGGGKRGESTFQLIICLSHATLNPKPYIPIGHQVLPLALLKK